MITIKDFMQVVDYRITEGSAYCWDCYGHHTYILDSWNGEQDGHSISMYFDTTTQEVYEVQAHDYSKRRAYRLINPKFVKKHKKEAKRRNINHNEAWDDVNYIDLETDEDWIEKATAIVTGAEYDTRIEVPLTVDNTQLFQLMKIAHDRDITLNELVEEILKEEIIKHK